MAALVAADRAARPVEPPAERTRVRVKVQAADEPGFEVVRIGDSYFIKGEKPRRWVQQTDFGNDEAVGYLADRLARLGVEEALAEAGAEPGAEVLIGDLDDAVVFDWDPAAPMASVHTMIRQVRPSGPGIAIRNAGVAVPAIRKKIIRWSSRCSRLRHASVQLPR